MSVAQENNTPSKKMPRSRRLSSAKQCRLNMARIIQAAEDGDANMPLEKAVKLVGCLEKLVRCIEVVDVEKRVAEILAKEAEEAEKAKAA